MGKIAAVTIAALPAIVLWALQPLLAGGSFLGNDDVEVVNRYFPMQVVPPKWIHSQGILLTRWMLVETQVRFFIVVALWAALIAFILLRHRVSMRTLKT